MFNTELSDILKHRNAKETKLPQEQGEPTMSTQEQAVNDAPPSLSPGIVSCPLLNRAA